VSAKLSSRATAAELRIQELARERAATQARRIMWPRLFAIQQQYLDWQEFYFWARSVIETEDGIPVFLQPTIDQRCPGFRQSLSSSNDEISQSSSLTLWDWIDERVFVQVRDEGWFDAVEFFAVRHPRYQRAQACWLRCIRDWQAAKPASYPSLEEWRHLAASCEPEDVLSPETQQAWGAFRRVAPARLDSAVRDYLDWQAFAYWVRTALENISHDLPLIVRRALEDRCPGFLSRSESGRPAAPSDRYPGSWERLVGWAHDHLFADAQKENWLDAILFYVNLHPRGIRIVDYWLAWDKHWSPKSAGDYPPFEQWLQEADTYVERNTSKLELSG
jgi:hypothetical protein